MTRKLWILLFLLLPAGCTSYYEGYENDYYASNYGSYYNAPLRVGGLQYHDFYMMDNYPGAYWDGKMWSAIGNISRFGIVSLSRSIFP